jgi:hypothetical protein
MGDPRFNSRKSHREYMKRNDLTTSDDWTQTWAKAAKDRENIRAGHDTMRRAQVAQAMHAINNRRR